MKNIGFLIVALFVHISCNQSAKSGKIKTLTGTSWKLTQMNGKLVDSKGTAPTLNFMKDGQVNGLGSCNHFGGSVEADSKGTIHFSNLVATEMACDNLSVEADYFKILVDAKTYVLSDSTLKISDDKGKSLVFVYNVI